MRDRLIEMFQDLSEETQQTVLEYMEHQLNRETPDAETTGISLEG